MNASYCYRNKAIQSHSEPFRAIQRQHWKHDYSYENRRFGILKANIWRIQKKTKKKNAFPWIISHHNIFTQQVLTIQGWYFFCILNGKKIHRKQAMGKKSIIQFLSRNSSFIPLRINFDIKLWVYLWVYEIFRIFCIFLSSLFVSFAGWLYAAIERERARERERWRQREK